VAYTGIADDIHQILIKTTTAAALFASVLIPGGGGSNIITMKTSRPPNKPMYFFDIIPIFYCPINQVVFWIQIKPMQFNRLLSFN
jgi:hypothetical protein